MRWVWAETRFPGQKQTHSTAGVYYDDETLGHICAGFNSPARAGANHGAELTSALHQEHEYLHSLRPGGESDLKHLDRRRCVCPGVFRRRNAEKAKVSQRDPGRIHYPCILLLAFRFGEVYTSSSQYGPLSRVVTAGTAAYRAEVMTRLVCSSF